jgi:7-cyano-7-deazaguanine synthase
MLAAQGFALHALTVQYGQVHDREVVAARAVASSLGVAQHVEVPLDLRMLAASALTGTGSIPKDRPLDALGVPPTYVPARNTIFLSLALAWAETIDAQDLVIGVNAVDYSGYPDCRPEYIRAFEQLARLATRTGLGGGRIRVHAPLLQMTKGEIISRGLTLGLDYTLTHSCYDPALDGRPCERCDSCLLRARGFAQAGVPDPLLS